MEPELISLICSRVARTLRIRPLIEKASLIFGSGIADRACLNQSLDFLIGLAPKSLLFAFLLNSLFLLQALFFNANPVSLIERYFATVLFRLYNVRSGRVFFFGLGFFDCGFSFFRSQAEGQ